MSFQLIIFDPDASNVAALRSAFAGIPSVSIQLVEKMRYLSPPEGIDVLYLPLAAAERWGSKPLVHESQILATTSEDQKNGLPAFIVTGTCLAENDLRGPVPETSLVLTSAFDAIRAFNKGGNVELRRVGFWAYNLLKGLSASQLRIIATEAVPELL
jgi:hypothetical protein